MSRHRIDSATMGQLLTQLGDVTGYANELIAQVEAIRDTVSAQWSGEANAQYQVLHAEWAAAAQRMAAGADHITQKAMAASKNYVLGADASKGLWG